jgi:hypothetical protein
VIRPLHTAAWRHATPAPTATSRIGRRRRPQVLEIVWPKSVQVAAAHQRQVAVDLLRQQLDRVQHAGCAPNRRSEQERPADEHEIRPERQRRQDVRAAPEPAVDQQRQVLRGGADSRQHVQRRRRRIELAPAVVRHHDPVHPAFARNPRILGRQDAFQRQRPFPQPACQLHMVPGQGGVLRHLLHLAGEQVRSALGAQVRDVRDAVRHQRRQRAGQHPARMPHPLQQQFRVRPDRLAVAGAELLFPIRLDGHVHRHGEHRESGIGDSAHHRLDRAELRRLVGGEPRPRTGPRQLLHRRDRVAAEHEGNARGMRRLRHVAVAGIGHHRRAAHRRDAERRGIAPAEQRARLVTLRHAGQHPRDKTVIEERIAVGVQRGFVLAAAGDVAEDRMRQQFPCRDFEVGQVVDRLEPARGTQLVRLLGLPGTNERLAPGFSVRRHRESS